MPASPFNPQRNFASLLRFLLALLTLATASAVAQEMGNTLKSTASLDVGQYLRSSNKAYRLEMQKDGNLALYREPSTYIWGTGATAGRRAVMQSDGNLCLANAGGANVWCNYSNGTVGDYFMVMRDTGALEIYRGMPVLPVLPVLPPSVLGLPPGVPGFAPAVPRTVPRDLQGVTSPAPALVWTTLLDTAYYGGRYALAGDNRKLMQHWVDTGRNEGRSPNASMNDDAYQAAKNTAFMQATARPVKGNDYLRVGDWINARPDGGYLLSQNGQFKLVVQTDGNACIYLTSSNRGLWCSLKNSLDPNYYSLVVLANGLICVYSEGAFNASTGTITRASNGDIKGSPRYCLPDAKGGSNRGYFSVLSNDGALTMFRNGSREQPLEPVWNSAMLNRLDIKDIHLNWWQSTFSPVINATNAAGNFFKDGYQIVSNGTQNVVSVVAKGTVDAAKVVEKGTVDTANQLARETEKAAILIAKETVNAATVLAKDTVNTANLVANNTERVAVIVGRSVESAGQVVGKEIIKDGKIVGYAVANLAVDAWNSLKGSCGVIGRRVFPIDPYFQGYKQITGVVNTYGSFIPGSAELKKATDMANQCFDWAQDGFYCAFPAQMEKLVSQSANIPGNLLNLATRVFNEAKTEECLIAGAATAGMGLPMCAMGKVVVNDAKKAFACFSAAEAKGVMKKFYTSSAKKADAPSFPNQASCQGIGELAFSVAILVVTEALSAEAAAAKQTGKSNTVAIVADELRTVYRVAAAGADYNQIVGELDALPECK